MPTKHEAIMVNQHAQPSTGIKPTACISMDLDNQWSYMKTHGDKGWQALPTYLDLLIPHVVEILERLGLKITFFIVGKDAAQNTNQDAIRLITETGHDVGNHSYSHEPWLHHYSKSQIRKEILDTEDQIIRITGQKPSGFRGPGFSWSADVLEVLSENQYLYDASSFPTYLGPLARLYYFWTSELDDEEKKKREGLFGSFRDGLRPLKPHLWELPSGRTLLEIPVTTIPVVKTPFHLSYLLYLSRFSLLLMEYYLSLSLLMCKITKTPPSFLLHPLDLLGRDKAPGLDFFPGMDIDSSRKADLFTTVIRRLSKSFRLTDMKTFAEYTLTQGTHTVPVNH